MARLSYDELLDEITDELWQRYGGGRFQTRDDARRYADESGYFRIRSAPYTQADVRWVTRELLRALRESEDQDN